MRSSFPLLVLTTPRQKTRPKREIPFKTNPKIEELRAQLSKGKGALKVSTPSPCCSGLILGL